MTKTKERQIKNSFIYLFPTLVGNAIPIITLPIFTRILTKEDYGVWALAQVYAAFASGLANFGLIIGYERNFFQYRDSKKTAELLYSTLSFVVVAFLVFCLLTYLFKSQISKLVIGSSLHSNVLFWSFCATTVVGLKNYYLTYFKNTENATSYVWYTIDELFLGVVFSMFFVVYVRIGVIGLIWGQLLASLIVFSVLFIRFLKILPPAFSWELLKDSLKLSYPLTPRLFLNVIGTQFDKYMVGLLSSVGGVGIYSIGQKLAYVVFAYMTALQNVYSPQVYKRMFDLGDGGGESIGKYLTPFAYASIAVALMVALFSEEIINILTPASYHSAIDIVIILSMLYGVYFFGKQPQLLYAKRTLITSILTMVSIGLSIALNIPFIMKWGVVGAAWATFLAGAISGLVSFVVSQHYYKIIWEYKKIGVIFLIFFGSSIMMILLRNAMAGYEIRFMVKIISVAIYLYLGIALGVVTKENFSIIFRTISLRRVENASN